MLIWSAASIGSLVSRAHPDGQHFTGAVAWAVVRHGVHRSEPALIGALGVLLVGVHVRQRRVDIHGQGIGASRPDGGLRWPAAAQSRERISRCMVAKA